MPVPAINTITPSSGHSSGGYILEVEGTGINLPHPWTAPNQDLVPPVSVTVDGVAVDPLTVETLPHATEAGKIVLRFSAPAGVPADFVEEGDDEETPHGAVDVVVQNLDAGGDSVDGEAGSLEAGFTYQRPNLARDWTLARCLRKLRRLLREQVLNHVVITMHTDYADEPGPDRMTKIATVPALNVHVMGVPWDRLAGTGEQEAEERDDEVDNLEPPDTVDLELEILAFTAQPVQLLNILEACTRFLKKNPTVAVDRDPDDSTRGKNNYRLIRAGDPTLDAEPNADNLSWFRWRWKLEGVDLETFDVVCVTALLGDEDEIMELANLDLVKADPLD